ncbi:hypothetical protein [Phreatobacter stygius]|uniref:DUF4815 domain-containing protein n=1 Tax=Phreatobacter stygius TaxID=1940610 RepID=A0A4D7BBS3_9HYPH|nr:hypothetical protein [Phreatobacter stygius]QCI65532.1 hypothetical protein E8M01_15750 [Phreatobacter stygius]
MLSKVTFRARQEVVENDFNNLQGHVEATLDHLVADTISTQKRFSGFEVTSVSATEINVAPGRLFASGEVYAAAATVQKSLFDFLPAAAKRLVTVYIWQGTAEVDIQPRSYLIDVDNDVTQSQTVSMRHDRVANVGLIAGLESADPQRSPLGAQFLAVCDILLTPTGIADGGITMIAGNRMPRLTEVDSRVGLLEKFQASAEPRIQTIGSDISALANRLKGSASTRAIIEMASDIARLKDVVGLPDDYSSYAADFYLTSAETDVTNLDLLAKVEEGVRFGPENQGDSQISVFNALDPAQVVKNGVLLPAHASIPRITVASYAGELRLSQYQSQAQTIVQKTMSRQRVRYGQEFSVCTNARNYWAQGQIDPTSNVFTLNGESFIINNPEELRGAHNFIRLQQYWIDSYEEPYWDVLTTTTVVNGQTVAQTFLNSQDGWLTGLRVGLTRLAGSGAITLAVCETYLGAPDLSKTVAQVTVQRADLRLFPQDGMTLFPLAPTFLSAGGRYAIVLVTAADHYAAVASGGEYAQGTLFYSTDGAWFEGDFTKDLVFSVEFARFERVRTVVELQPLQLNGGISSLDILAGMVVPRSCQCYFEVQKSGSGWEPIDSLTPAKLIGLPPLLQFRAVLIGTTDVAPGIRLSGSRVRLSRPRTTFKHISTPRTLPVPTSQVQVTVRLENWSGTRHAHAMRLLCGAPGFATIELPDVTDTTPTEDPKAIIRTYTFNTTAPVSAYKIEQSGTTSTALDTYLVSTRVDIAF